MTNPYDYEVVAVRRVVDGDTVDLVLSKDVGFHITAQAAVRIRLLNVDTPERGQPGWAEAGAFVTEWLRQRDGEVRCSTHKSDSFGRWLGYVYVLREDQTAEALNDALVTSGHAEVYSR